MDKEALEQFAKEVSEGLSAIPKSLPSKYFYDERGDELFVKIMNSPEYYLTDCEFEIFSEQTDEVIRAFEVKGRYFDLYELGAGDGTKTMELLKGLTDYDFTYRPIDISSHAIETLEARVHHQLPNVAVEGMQGEYFGVLDAISSEHPKVILFMGSNIGNMLDQQAQQFLQKLSDTMRPGDKLLMGVDLKKKASVVLPAYNDAQGYTSEFNLNLLDRINRELGGEFDREKFIHAPEYDAKNGWAKSYLKSKENQEVSIAYLNRTFSFEEGERIDMEISRKYDDETIAKLSDRTGLSIRHKFYDKQNYFCDILFEHE